MLRLMPSRLTVIAFVLLSVVATVSPLYAAALPEFPETEHVLPPTETPAPAIPLLVENGFTVVFYAVALLLAVLAVHKYRSRRMIFGLTILSVILFGFLLKGCPCPIGTMQNVVAALFLPQYVAPLIVIVLFLLPLLVALFYGRVFCSCVCPLGAVQELVAIKPQRIPLWLEHALGLFRYFYLGLAFVFAGTGLWFILCRFDPFVSFFRFSGFMPILIYGGVLLLIGIWIARPYCRFLCPYGALLGLCSTLAKHHVSVTPGECTKCRLCEEICPYEAIRKPTLEPNEEERRKGPRRLLKVLLISPLIILFFTALGYNLAMPVAREHWEIRQAELLHAEETGLVPDRGTFRETRAFQKTRETSDELYARAANVYVRIRTATTLWGAWVGLVISAKLISLATRRRRTEYEVDSNRCLACGRCFWYCPNQNENRLLLDIETKIESKEPHAQLAEQ